MSANFISLLKPVICYRKYYVLEKFQPPCKCIMKCKYPPPGPKVRIPVKTYYYPRKFEPVRPVYRRDP